MHLNEVCCLLAVFFIPIFAIRMFPFLWSLKHLSPLTRLALMLEYAVENYLAWVIDKTALLLIITVIVLPVSLRLCFQTMNKNIESVHKRYRASHFRFFIHHERVALRVHAYIQGYSRMINYVLVSNQVWYWLFFIFLITNLPVNVIFCARLVRTKWSQFSDNDIVMVIVLGVQTVGSVVSMLPIANVCNEIHSGAVHITPIQMLVRKPWPIKYKLMVLFEMVNSNKMIGYSPGPLSVISHQKLFEVREDVTRFEQAESNFLCSLYSFTSPSCCQH